MTSSSDTLDRVTATSLGQAGVRFEFRGSQVIIDPFISDYPGRLVPPQASAADLARADLILVSHEHADHFDLDALNSMPDSTTTIIVPLPLVQIAREGGVRHRVIGARPGYAFSVGSVRVHPVSSMHGLHVADAYNFGTEISGGEHRYLGYVVEFGGLRIYHSGDTIDYPGLAQVLATLDPDIAFLPINGRDLDREGQNLVGNLSAAESIDLAVRAGIGCIAPMHYDMFANNLGSLGQFVDLAQSRIPHVCLLIPRVGGPIPLPTRNELFTKGHSA